MGRSKAQAPARLGLLIDRYYWLQECRRQTARRDGQVLAVTLAGTVLYLAGPWLGLDAANLLWFELVLLGCAAAYALATLDRRLRTLDCAARAERELEEAGYAVAAGVVHDRRGRAVERPTGLALAFETPRPRAAIPSRGTGA